MAVSWNCVHTDIHTCIHAYKPTNNTCTDRQTYMHTCMHAYMHTCTHAYMHICIHAYMHTCMHTYMHTYMHAYMHIYVRINIPCRCKDLKLSQLDVGSVVEARYQHQIGKKVECWRVLDSVPCLMIRRWELASLEREREREAGREGERDSEIAR